MNGQTGPQMEFETAIGLEIHVELMTQSKMYCACATRFGAAENTQICPVCAGFPGALPVLNGAAVRLAVRAGLALGCTITAQSHQDRKHYFSPDLPKAYQCSQVTPLCGPGQFDYELDGRERTARITRVHIEEDAGKLIHDGDSTRIDLNRSGVPLIEIVTAPDFHTGAEAAAFVEELRAALVEAGVTTGRMEQGALRCDVNLSLRPAGTSDLGERTEIKNLNSFGAIRRAIAWEEARQTALLRAGKRVECQTLRWDDHTRSGTIMRTKENATDYNFLPDPDIYPIAVDAARIDEMRKTLPALPSARRARCRDCGLSPYDARQVASDPWLFALFEEAVTHGAAAKATANALLGDVRRLMNENDGTPIDLSASQLAEIVHLTETGKLSLGMASRLFELLLLPENQGKPPKTLVDTLGLAIIDDASALQKLCTDAIQACPKAASDFRAGKEKALSALVGQIMKASNGQAEPAKARTCLIAILRQTDD